MRNAGVATLLALAALVRPAIAPSQTPDACYVAEVGVVLTDGSDFRIHRLVVTQIRKLAAAPDATPENCQAQNPEARVALRRAVDVVIDSMRLAPPRNRQVVEYRLASLDMLRSQLRMIAARARERAGDFVRVEVLDVNDPALVDIPPIELPRFAKDDQDAAACAEANGKRGARGNVRWAC